MIKREELANPHSCLNRASEEEELFVLLGRDRAFAAAVEAWIAERILLGLNRPEDPQILEAKDLAVKVKFKQRQPSPEPLPGYL